MTNYQSFRSTFRIPAVHASILRWAALLLLLPALGAPSAETQKLHGQVLAAVARLQAVGPLAASSQLKLAIALPLRHPEELASLLHELYDPASPNYRHYLTPEQFADRFGPTEQDYQALAAFIQANGLTVAGRHPNRLLLDVTGSVANIEQALHVKLQLYPHPTENRIFFAPDAEPSLDLAVPVLRISGLDNYSRPRPRLQAKALPATRTTAPNAGSGPGGTYMGNDFRAAYVPDSALTGSGQVVGLVQFDGYNAGDITYYEQKNGLPNVPLQNVLLDGFNGAPSGFGGEVEVCLDIEMAISMAPGLSQVIVYMAGPYGNWHDTLNRIATDNLAQQVSCSWYSPGAGPDPVADQIWQQMAAQGQSFFNASGDYDAYTGPIDFPGESPYITQVGGTTLSTASAGGPWVSEKVWNWGNGIGSAGGISTQYPIPYWQTNAITAAGRGSTTMRNTPDVALTADNVYVRADAQDHNVGGTSCAAPLWAAFMALVNQRAVQAGKSTLGFVNPAIYALGQQPFYSSAFHDITAGNNERPGSPNKFVAVAGYDLCTGWGTPASSRLITALATPDPLIIIPGTGFSSLGVAGGPFSITSQAFTLTNSGSASLDWTLVNTSAWLTASASGGTLVPGGPAANISIGLNSVASNLLAGTYSAAVWFTNLNDGVGQSLLFNLAILDPPVITNPPSDQAVLEGATAQFKVGVAGSLPLSYSWLLYGTNLTDSPLISGSAANTLNIYKVSTSSLGPYSVVVSNPVGVVTSAVAHLTITPSPPVIVSQPADQTVFVGQRATFSVSVVGTSPYLYQWTFSGTNLPGATGSRLRLLNVQFAQAGSYAVIVSNSLGFTLSSNALLTVNPAPPCAVPSPFLVDWWQGEDDGSDAIGGNEAILTGGASFTNGMVGDAFAFDGVDGRVTVSNAPSFNFGPNQNFSLEAWISPLPSVTDYDVMSVVDKRLAPNLSQCLGYEFNLVGGRIHCRLSSSIGGVGSDWGPAGPDMRDGNFHHVAVSIQRGSTNGGNLYVDGHVVLTFDPTSQTGDLSNSDPLRIGYHATASLNCFFKGIIDEVSIYNGALSTADIQAIFNAGISGKCLTPVPPLITVQPGDQTVAIGGTATFIVTAAGTRPLIYQWFKGGVGISGATDSAFTLINAQLTDAGLYSAQVSNLFGATLSSNAVLAVLQPPAITGQPQSTTVPAGTSATFTVTASGDPPLFYQWLKEGVGIPGATDSAYTISSAQLTDAGSYSVLVSNLVGSALSSNALLTVLQAPIITSQPQDQTVLVGQIASFNLTATGTPPLSYQWFKGGVAIDSATNSTYFVASAQTNDAGFYTGQVSNLVSAVLSSNALLTVLGPQTNCAPAPAGLVDWWRAEGDGSDSAGTNTAILTGGVTFTNGMVGRAFYYNGVDGRVTVSNASGVNFGPNQDFSIEGWISPLPSTTDYDVMSVVDKRYAPNLSQCLGYEFNLVGGRIHCRLSTSISGVGSDWGPAGPDLRDGNLHHVALSLQRNSTSGGNLYVDGQVVLTFDPTSQNGDLSNADLFRIGYHATSSLNCFFKGRIDELSLYTRALSTADILMIFNAGNAGKCGASTPPYITGQPASQTIAVGATAGLGVSAVGTPPLSYQWFKGGVGISGATNSTFVVTNAQTTDTGVYSVLVTNLFGSALSSNAFLSVLQPPVITSQPQGTNTPAGSSVTFSVTANGDAPLAYQWRKAGIGIVGATGSAFTIASVQLADSGNYSVLVSNLVGSALSSNALLTVLQAPIITNQPQSQTVLIGQMANFYVAAIGTPPLSYQWFKGGVGIAGATTSAFIITSAQTNDGGFYSVQITNVVGSVLSSNALLTVLPPQTNCAPAPAGLVSWWRAEGDGSDSASTNNAVLTGGVSFTNGMVGQAFNFNGVDGRVTVSNSPSVNFGAGQDFSIEAWINPLPSTTDYDVMSVVDKRLAPNLSQCLGYEFPLNGGRLAFRISSSYSGNGAGFGPAGPDLRDGKFHHVAVSLQRNSTTGGHLYADGQLVLTFDPTSQSGDLSNTEPLRIGFHATPTLHCFFKGRIDEVSLYNRALSTAEILAIYNAGSGGKCPLPPVIAAQPHSQQVIQGTNVSFSVIASSAWPLSYQWLFNGTNLPGATASMLTLTNVRPKQAGTYAVLVGNASGAVVSSNATLNVLVPARILRQPARQLVQSGCSAYFQVTTAGTAPLTYQWWKDGAPLTGQTTTALTIASVQTNDLGNYWVVVTNLCGSATSSNAVLAWNHPPVAMPDTIFRFATGGVRVPASVLVANDTDADGDSLSVTGVSPTSEAGGIVGLNGGWVYYQPPPGFTNTDSFAYTVSDGNCYGSAIGLVTVQLRTDNTPISHLTLEPMGDGAYRISIDGVPGENYRLQCTENLSGAAWQDLATGTADVFGVFQYVHSPPTNAPARFYRAVWP